MNDGMGNSVQLLKGQLEKMTLEFATTISCAVDMLADACAGVCAGANTRVVSGMRVDVLEAMMTVWELTLSVPIEEPACFC